MPDSTPVLSDPAIVGRVALRAVARTIATPVAVALLAQVGLGLPSAMGYTLALASVVVVNARDLLHGRLNPIAAVVLLNIGVSLGLLRLGEESLLARQVVFYAVLGMATFASFATPRPVTFYFGRQLLVGGGAARLARYDAAWHFDGGRQVHRLVTTVWGVSFGLQAAVSFGMLNWLHVPLVTLLAPVVLISMAVATWSWTVLYVRRQERRFATARLTAVAAAEVPFAPEPPPQGDRTHLRLATAAALVGSHDPRQHVEPA